MKKQPSLSKTEMKKVIGGVVAARCFLTCDGDFYHYVANCKLVIPVDPNCNVITCSCGPIPPSI